MGESERFWAKVKKTDGCWVWTAATDSGGYGRFNTSRPTRKMKRAHRIAYELMAGPIPDGLQIDHLCRNRGCVNPAHLEPVTQTVNQRRGVSATKAACKHGHAYTPENTKWKVGGKGLKSCRACRAIHERSARARRLAAGAVSDSGLTVEARH
jgi:hypothetical protein